MKNPVPRVAAIHDLSGFGRSSLTVVIPVLATMGAQVCPLPTAVLSTHTSEFKNYSMLDLTGYMADYIRHWESLHLEFDAIYSGFLGSSKQVEIVASFIDKFSKKDQLIVVDPVLGDDGEPYGPIGNDLIEGMRALIGHADIITPNFTEAAFLLNYSYDKEIREGKIKEWIRELSDKGPRIVIMTSVPVEEAQKITSVIAYNRNDARFWRVNCNFIPAFYPGTGDIFTSVIVGSILQGDSLPIALDRAVQFVSIAIRASFGYDLPKRDGVLLERVLDNLRAPIVSSTYEILE
ncbi:MAG: pyridoxamine kinase [Spirochaetota bacterium]